MLKENIIVPSSSPWAAPIVLVDKPDGSIRFCVDYRKLNSLTVPDLYPLPRMDDIIECLATSQYISIIDLSSGYWQICLEEKSRDKSSFINQVGIYHVKRLPFGLKNTEATFQRMMNKLLHDLPFASAYLDDPGIFCPDFAAHMSHIETVLCGLQNAGLTVKASTCQWIRGKVLYLGHLIEQEEIHPNPAKVDTIQTVSYTHLTLPTKA